MDTVSSALAGGFFTTESPYHSSLYYTFFLSDLNQSWLIKYQSYTNDSSMRVTEARASLKRLKFIWDLFTWNSFMSQHQHDLNKITDFLLELFITKFSILINNTIIHSVFKSKS